MKKDDIIAAALVEFSSHNYEGASTNSIIDQSGTSKGTFYHHFNSKEDLYLELIRMVADEKVQFMRKVAVQEQSHKPTGSLFDLLRSQIEASIRFSVAHPEFARFSAKVAKETSEAIRDRIDQIIGDKAYELFSQLIRTNIEKKYLRSDLPEEFVTRVFLFMISHFNDFLLEMNIEIEVNNMEKISAILADYIEFIETGLGSRRPRTETDLTVQQRLD